MSLKRSQGGKTGRGQSGKKERSAKTERKFSDRGGKRSSSYGESDKRESYSDKKGGKKIGDRKSGGTSKDGYAKKSYGDDDRKKGKSFGDRDKKFGDKKSYDSKGGYAKKSYGDDDRKKSKSYGDRDSKFGDKKSYDSKGGYARKSYGDDDRKKSKSYGDRDSKFGDKKSYDSKGGYARKSYGDDDRKKGKSYGDRDSKFGDKKSYDSKGGYAKKSYGDDDRKRSKSFGDRDNKSGDKKSYGSKSGYVRKSFDDDDHKKGKSFGDRDSKFVDKKSFSGTKGGYEKKSHSEDWDDRKKKSSYTGDADEKKAYKKRFTSSHDEDSEFFPDELNEAVDHTEKKKTFEKKKGEYEKLIKRSQKNIGRSEKKDDGTIRLNKYLSNSGVASRRDADKLIESGAVTVNGVVVTQLGTRIKSTDKVQYGGQSVKKEKLVYILLNKPKDYITTMDDPQGRKTVMSLIRGAVKERVYPVGRLDRNTTGVILFTNDGELTRRLTHPKFLVSKMYHITLDKNFSKEDLDEMRKGLELEDGFIKPDQLEYSGETKKELGIEIHSGRNRIVRRMFEHLGYEVVKLDRVQFAGLNKKDIPRGKWRFLNEKEVGFLKML